MVGNASFKGLGWGFLGALGFASAIYYGNQLVQKGRENPNKNLTWENVKQFWNENWKEILITSGSVIGGSLAIRESTEAYNPIYLLEDNPVHRIWKQLEKETPQSQQVLGFTLDNHEYYVLKKYKNYHVLTQGSQLHSAAQSLIDNGVRPSPNPDETLIGLCDDSEDLIYWLEEGSVEKNKGWKHIKFKHIDNRNEMEEALGSQFTRENLIHWLFKTVVYGKKYRNNKGKLSYILEINERRDKILLAAVGDNGYIVSFHLDERNTKDANRFENWRDRISWKDQ